MTGKRIGWGIVVGVIVVVLIGLSIKERGGKATEISIAKWINPGSKLSELRGKVVLLDFWGVWCPPCIVAMPKIQKLHERYKGDGLEVIGIHSAHVSEGAADFAAEHQYTFAIGIDEEIEEDDFTGRTAKDYQVDYWPSYFLIDKKGRVVWRAEKDLPPDEVIERYLKK